MAFRRLTDAEILAQIPAARARERAERRAGLRATSAKYDRASGRIVLELTNGFAFAFPVAAIGALRGMSTSQLRAVELDGSGGILCWDAADMHLSVPGLLLFAVGKDERSRHFASVAGRSTSPAKAAAARANGAKGGRPRKTSR
jgi:hypothetical protein